MKDELFRKKSLDKVKSPENLDDFIRVSNPGVWLLLISVIVLLAGACVWGIFGRVESTAPVRVYAENGNVICYAAKEDISSVSVGMTVRFDGYEAVVSGLLENADDGCYLLLEAKEAIPEGLYDGKLVIAEYRPVSFVLN